MKWLVSTLIMLICAVPTSTAQSQSCLKSEVECVLDATWTAALMLPEEKRAGLARTFLEIAQLSGDAAVLAFWEHRLNQTADAPASYSDYGWEIARPVLAEHGVGGLIEMAAQRAAPISVGRADALLSAGRHLQDTDPASAARLNQALLSMIGAASQFEKPSLAHAAAELAMIRCDVDLMTEALVATDAPRSLRYAFWRARISGNALGLMDRVRSIETDDDTRDVRRVLDGYRAILELGYCAAPKTAIGG